jgi:N utilization substance protein B
MGQSSRTKARRAVLQALYALETGGPPGLENLEAAIGNEALSAAGAAFARHLYDLAIEHRAWSDQQIASLAHNWRLERIAVIDQVVLRMAMTELKTMPDVPIKVVLNEAIELVKLYSTAESSAFVNGILDNFIKNSTEISGV